jgi:phage gp36-like protein
METTNPAGRLHALLEKAKATPGGSAIDLWAIVFGITETDVGKKQVEVIHGLLQMRQLIDETHDSLRAISDLHDRYFRPFERIRAVLTQSFAQLQTDIHGQLNSVTEGDMTTLEFCSERLETQHTEPLIDEDQLQAILLDANALFDEVKDGDFDPDLKSFILDGIESIRRAIFEFRIRGPERIKEAIADILADYMMNQRTPQTPEERASLEKFNDAFARFVSLVTFAVHTQKLISVIAGPLLIGPGESPPDTTAH